MTSLTDTKWRDACAVIGEITLLHTALDHQLNVILIEVLSLPQAAMLESVIATLDSSRKIEIIKAHAKHVKHRDWRKALDTHVDRLERVARARNTACHTPLVPAKNGGFEFAPAAASKLLKTLRIKDRTDYSVARTSLGQIRDAVQIAEKALSGGEDIKINFGKLRAELMKRTIS